MPMNIGIIGAGNIAAWMAKTIGPMPEAASFAVASRDLKKSFGIRRRIRFPKSLRFL